MQIYIVKKQNLSKVPGARTYRYSECVSDYYAVYHVLPGDKIEYTFACHLSKNIEGGFVSLRSLTPDPSCLKTKDFKPTAGSIDVVLEYLNMEYYDPDSPFLWTLAPILLEEIDHGDSDIHVKFNHEEKRWRLWDEKDAQILAEACQSNTVDIEEEVV